MRGRASMLLATASISVSLLGQDAFHGVRPLAMLAVACFAFLSVCVIVIVWPDAEWNFDLDSHSLLTASLSRAGPSSSELVLQVIAFHAVHRRINARLLARVARAFRVGACLLAIQIVLTMMAASFTL